MEVATWQRDDRNKTCLWRKKKSKSRDGRKGLLLWPPPSSLIAVCLVYRERDQHQGQVVYREYEVCDRHVDVGLATSHVDPVHGS